VSLHHLDLQQLLVLDALLQERNVSAAAQRLGLAQSTVSTALARLRTTLGDELFVKHALGVEPTARALALRQPLAQVLALLQDQILTAPAFDPPTSRRTFVLVFGELGQMVFVPRLLAHLRGQAPGVDLRVLGGSAEHRQALLESGQADLAVGLFPEFGGASMFQQKLYAARPLVVLMRQDHPAAAAGALTLEAFARLDHAVVGTDIGYQALCEAALKQRGIERRIVVELSSLSAAPHVLAGTDLVAVVPATVADLFCRQPGLRHCALPLELPQWEVRQFWHRRRHHDPGLVWLRQQIAAQFQPAPVATAQEAVSRD
jgi:DNA-binding transcriptional LysR family regulator